MGRFKHYYQLQLRKWSNSEVTEFKAVTKEELLEEIKFHLQWDTTLKDVPHFYLIKVVEK